MCCPTRRVRRAETMLADLEIKAKLYGRADYLVYWVATHDAVHEHTSPSPRATGHAPSTGAVSGFRSPRRYSRRRDRAARPGQPAAGPEQCHEHCLVRNTSRSRTTTTTESTSSRTVWITLVSGWVRKISLPKFAARWKTIATRTLRPAR